MATPVAQQIADMFDNDGMNFDLDDGRTLQDVCKTNAAQSFGYQHHVNGAVRRLDLRRAIVRRCCRSESRSASHTPTDGRRYEAPMHGISSYSYQVSTGVTVRGKRAGDFTTADFGALFALAVTQENAR